MTFLKTLLASLALCAALLVWAGFEIGPERPTGRTGPGLTAAAVLASDGMAPDGRPGGPATDGGGLDRAALARLAGRVSGEVRDASAAAAPAG
ncbi:hypothetical protein [Methylobacterium radiotolerans]|uniref:hypothetical protein n=1 Tax=Methylobacterium radiotolerans TaxID=31998 RepID=UPI001F446D1C|nr:hypothetical protein [Methylobacterium radiotolerans]UIY41691.1 hypothetical protein LZ599_25380 [Methylobacterium radiotolerans]